MAKGTFGDGRRGLKALDSRLRGNDGRAAGRTEEMPRGGGLPAQARIGRRRGQTAMSLALVMARMMPVMIRPITPPIIRMAIGSSRDRNCFIRALPDSW